MVDMMIKLLTRFSTKAAASVVAATFLLGGVSLLSPTVAGAKSTTNVFTFTGANTGTIKLTSSNLNCMWGKTYSGKGYLVTLSHMKGTIAGAGAGPWAMTLYVPKQGTTHVTKANVHAINDSSLQNNASPIVTLVETSGTITDKGSKGTIDLKVESHSLASSTYGAPTTVTGSWNCPNGLSDG
jgi:uncharacterized protein (DUF2147 family)